jgi:Mitochondrial carrier protein
MAIRRRILIRAGKWWVAFVVGVAAALDHVHWVRSFQPATTTQSAMHQYQGRFFFSESSSSFSVSKSLHSNKNSHDIVDNCAERDISDIDDTRRMILLGSLVAISTGSIISSLPLSSLARTTEPISPINSRNVDEHDNDLTISSPFKVDVLSDLPTTHSVFDPTLTSTNLISDAAITASATAGGTSMSAPTGVDWKGVFQKAGKRALGSGKAGAAASVVQVMSLMWLRTSMNYQYRYGGDLKSSLRTLWDDGGIGRLYQGLPFALVQGPLTRFGDTAANVGILALLDTIPETRDLPLPIKTGFGSVSAGLWRIFLMPLDASKTSLQVEGKEGLSKLWGLVKEEGPAPLYYGALAQASATAAGHWPWFLTFNYVDKVLPVVSASDDLLLSLVRSAFLGLSASCVSDVVSNSLRVIKTTKQTARLGDNADDDGVDDETRKGDDGTAVVAVVDSSKSSIRREPSYPEIVAAIIEKDGINGLLFRGLQTRLLTNSIQGALFSVVWKYLQQTS